MGELYKQKDWLIQKHVVEKLKFREIGELVDCSESKISYWAMKLGVTNKAKKKVETELVGGDGKVSCVCQFCGHRKYMVAVNPSVREVERWLSEYQCSICHKRRNLKA